MTFSVYIFTLQFRGLMTIDAKDMDIDSVLGFIQIFNSRIDEKSHIISIECEQQNTKKFLEKLILFADKYVQVKKLVSKFKTLKENEYFMVLPSQFSEIKDNMIILGCENYLCELNGLPTLNTNALPQQIQKIIKHYNVSYIGINNIERPISIGEPKKSKRICRFCGKSQPQVKFTKKAHAISEALGNTKIILNEECDECNEFFGRSIEKDFILYHSFDRVLFQINTKNTNHPPIIKSKDFKIERNTNGVSVLIKTDEQIFKPPNFSHLFHCDEKITPQNFYKALCKYALSVIDVEYIKYFNETIKWLKGKKIVSQLPKIVEVRDYRPIKMWETYPLILYIRRGKNQDLPFLIGEFNFTIHKYIFIVPFCSQDTQNFVDLDNIKKLYKKYYSGVYNSDNYRFIDCSSSEKKPFKMKLNFRQVKG